MWFALQQHIMPSHSQRRLNTFRQTFKPYFAQQTNEERETLHKKMAPQRVCFAWAVRHKVTHRADDDDVAEGRAAYWGQAMGFDKDNQLSPPTMTFDSGRNYCNWRESQYHTTTPNKPRHAAPPEEIDDVPDWMLDMESEQHNRFH